jgi:hypothetical protein
MNSRSSYFSHWWTHQGLPLRARARWAGRCRGCRRGLIVTAAVPMPGPRSSRANARPPCSSMAEAVSSSGSTDLPSSMTSVPWAARAIAIARPMFRPAPVTMAVRPASPSPRVLAIGSTFCRRLACDDQTGSGCSPVRRIPRFPCGASSGFQGRVRDFSSHGCQRTPFDCRSHVVRKLGKEGDHAPREQEPGDRRNSR